MAKTATVQAQQMWEYLELTREYFGAALAELNFAETEKACRAVNLWVNRKTWGKIPE